MWKWNANTQKLSFIIFLSFLLLINIFVCFSSGAIKTQSAQANFSSLPHDQDAWTENDNVTYVWRVSPSYQDAMAFTAQDAVVGSYSLNVNHTTTSSYMAFGLDINSSQDLTAYDVIIFRFKMVRAAGWAGALYFYTGNTGLFAGARHKVVVKADANRWIKVVFPLEAFVVNSGSPDWSAKRYFDFMLSGVSSGDNARVYIDGLYIATWETITETTPLDETMLPNYDSFIKRWQKTVVYNGISYTSLRSMVPVSGSTFGYKSLESEVLGQTIYGYMLAYNHSRIQYYLDEAQQYVNLLLQFQYNNASSAGDGGFFRWFNNGTKAFDGLLSDTYNGWILAGLSYYYHFSSNSTVKTTTDKLASFLMATLWDDANKWYDQSFNTATQTKTDNPSWNPAPQGAIATGLSLYYKYVTQNNTVQTQLDATLNYALTSGSPSHNFYTQMLGYEGNMYGWWGYYWSYRAFNNQTYYDKFLQAVKLTRADYEINGNGSVYYYNYLTEYSFFDGWGFACALPLLFLSYEETLDNNYLELFENQVLDLTPTIQTGNYSITRYRGSGDQWETYQYLPSNAFIVAALNAYYNKIYKPNRPYLLSINKEITSSSYVSNKLTFTVSAASETTSITKVYCGEKGEPTRVLVDTIEQPINYNSSTRILTVTATHSSNPTEILVDWNLYPPKASFLYSPLNPYANDTVTFNASDSRPNGGHIDSCQWNFGDGFLDQGVIVTHMYNTAGTYKVTLNVTDSDGLWNTTTTTVTVKMPPPPSIWKVERSPELPEYNNTVTVTANITSQESGISIVILNYYNGSGWTNMTMTMQNELYVAAIPALPHGTIVQYKVYASTDFGNWAETDTFNCTVTDTIPPDIGSVQWNPIKPSPGEEVLVSAQVSEPAFASGVKTVTLLWTENGKEIHSSTMIIEDAVWKATIPGQGGDKHVYFSIESYDHAGNCATSQWYGYKVKVTEADSRLLVLVAILATVTVLIGITIGIAIRKKAKDKTYTKASHFHFN